MLSPSLTELKILKETDDYLVILKPAAMVVHPDKHHKDNTIWNFLQKKINFKSEDFFSGIIHRLDKPTTGLLIIAKNIESYKYFKEAIRNRKVVRKYYAICEGTHIEKKFTVDVPLSKPGKNKRAMPNLLGGKAITHFEVLKQNNQYSLLKCKLETGRTHQIRSHLKFLKKPIVNDSLYNKGNSNFIFLHAYYLSFIEPNSNKKIILETELPKWFEKWLKKYII